MDDFFIFFRFFENQGYISKLTIWYFWEAQLWLRLRWSVPLSCNNLIGYMMDLNRARSLDIWGARFLHLLLKSGRHYMPISTHRIPLILQEEALVCAFPGTIFMDIECPPKFCMYTYFKRCINNSNIQCSYENLYKRCIFSMVVL